MPAVINLGTSAIQSRVSTIADVAAKAGVTIQTAKRYLYTDSGSEAIRAKVRAAAQELGYNGKECMKANARRTAARNVGTKKKTPANPVFASREAETAAMQQLSKAGHSTAEVAHRCGVCKATVVKRIGKQSADVTAANKKLAGQVRSAKAAIKKAYQQKIAVQEYNALAAKLNAHVLEAQKMQTSLNEMQKKATAASKATKVPLMRILSFPSTIAQ